jgi:hypothetical protein
VFRPGLQGSGCQHAIVAGLARIMRNDYVAMISEGRLSSEENLKVPRKIGMFTLQDLLRLTFVIKSRSQPI